MKYLTLNASGTVYYRIIVDREEIMSSAEEKPFTDDKIMRIPSVKEKMDIAQMKIIESMDKEKKYLEPFWQEREKRIFHHSFYNDTLMATLVAYAIEEEETN